MIAGMGPLLWLLAAQLLRAGARSTPSSTPRRARAICAALRHAPGIRCSRPISRKGLRLMREVRSQAFKVVVGVIGLEAEGDSKVRAVGFAAAEAARRSVLDVDQLLLHQGVVPNVNLAMSAGVDASLGRAAALLVSRARQ